MIELKPCPLCKGSTEILDAGDFIMLHCNGCGYEAVFDVNEDRFSKETLKNKIADLWNKKAVNMLKNNKQNITKTDTHY